MCSFSIPVIVVIIINSYLCYFKDEEGEGYTLFS